MDFVTYWSRRTGLKQALFIAWISLQGSGYITPKDMLEGRAEAIHAERDRKLEEARERRRSAREQEVPA